MRKWFSTLAVLAVVLGMLVTSCAPKATPTPTPKPIVQPTKAPTAIPPTAVPTPKPAEPVTITFWEQEGDTIDTDILDPLVNEFMAALDEGLAIDKTRAKEAVD